MVVLDVHHGIMIFEFRFQWNHIINFATILKF